MISPSYTDGHRHFLEATPSASQLSENASEAGTETRQMRFAQTSFGFSSLSESMATAIDSHYGEILDADCDGSASIELRVHRVPENFFRPVETEGWEYTLGLTHFENDILLSGISYAAHIDRTNLRAELFVGESCTDLVDPIENTFRAQCAYGLLRAGGVMLHSAGFALKDEAAICWGRSGAGKSTLTGLVHQGGMTVLSDELNALLPGPDGVVVQAMPFAGDFGRQPGPLHQYRVGALVTLAQEPVHSLRPLSMARALGTMAAAAPFVNGDPYISDDLFKNLERLLGGHKARTLAFANNESVVDFVRGQLFSN